VCGLKPCILILHIVLWIYLSLPMAWENGPPWKKLDLMLLGFLLRHRYWNGMSITIIIFKRKTWICDYIVCDSGSRNYCCLCSGNIVFKLERKRSSLLLNYLNTLGTFVKCYLSEFIELRLLLNFIKDWIYRNKIFK
jgi:hypothetical protein